MLALVRGLSGKRGISVLIVLHDVNMAARFCDEIVALREGRIVARGVPEAIVTPDALARIYGLAMGVLPHPVSGAPISYVQ
jgi:ferric hydroxamate transport system ATP-binding protein